MKDDTGNPGQQALNATQLQMIHSSFKQLEEFARQYQQGFSQLTGWLASLAMMKGWIDPGPGERMMLPDLIEVIEMNLLGDLAERDLARKRLAFRIGAEGSYDPDCKPWDAGPRADFSSFAAPKGELTICPACVEEGCIPELPLCIQSKDYIGVDYNQATCGCGWSGQVWMCQETGPERHAAYNKWLGERRETCARIGLSEAQAPDPDGSALSGNVDNTWWRQDRDDMLERRSPRFRKTFN